MQPQPESEPQHKKGKTVLKRVGATRQLSSQASLPLIPSEQSWKQTIGLPEEKCSKRETEAFIMNQMLTHYQHKASRKIPGGCHEYSNLVVGIPIFLISEFSHIFNIPRVGIKNSDISKFLRDSQSFMMHVSIFWFRDPKALACIINLSNF